MSARASLAQPSRSRPAPDDGALCATVGAVPHPEHAKGLGSSAKAPRISSGISAVGVIHAVRHVAVGHAASLSQLPQRAVVRDLGLFVVTTLDPAVIFLHLPLLCVGSSDGGMVGGQMGPGKTEKGAGGRAPPRRPRAEEARRAPASRAETRDPRASAARARQLPGARPGCPSGATLRLSEDVPHATSS